LYDTVHQRLSIAAHHPLCSICAPLAAATAAAAAAAAATTEQQMQAATIATYKSDAVCCSTALVDQ